jgi:glycosyltransferase involved in cell wall biosynthesis
MSLPRILAVHAPGSALPGVDAAVDAEAALLRTHGHDVERLLPAGAAPSWASALWSSHDAQALRATLGRFRPDLVHAHAQAGGYSPALLWAAAEHGVPVVLTLHDFALGCPQGSLLRAGRICEECPGGPPLPAVRHRCCGGSRRASLVAATALIAQRALGTWTRKVSRYIVPSDFCREQSIRAGLPAARLRVKPYFTAAPLAGPEHAGAAAEGGDFLYAGPLSEQSGVRVLAQALAQPGNLACTVAGDGPLRATLEGAAGLRLSGPLEAAGLSRQLQRATALVLPSLWFEPFAQAAIEAYAHGLPVIASRLGSLVDIVRDGKTGLLVEPGDALDLARKMRWARDNPAQMQAMGRTARTIHARRYSAQENYRQLLAVYDDAIASTPL